MFRKTSLGAIASYVVGHDQIRLCGPAEALLRELGLVGTEWASVRLALAFEIRCPTTDQGLEDDQRRPLRLISSRFERGRESTAILPIDRIDDLPAIGLEARGNIFAEGDLGPSVDGDLIVIVDEDEVSEFVMTGEGGCLRGDPFHEITIAHEPVHEMSPGTIAIRGIRSLGMAAAELRCRHPPGERHSDSMCESLAERPRRQFDAGRLSKLGMTRRTRAELSELRNVFDRKIESKQVEQRVLQHRSVAIGENETIAQRPGGILGIEAEMMIPEFECGRGEGHRRTDVTDSGPLDCVDGHETDCVLDPLEQFGSLFGGHVARFLNGRATPVARFSARGGCPRGCADPRFAADSNAGGGLRRTLQGGCAGCPVRLSCRSPVGSGGWFGMMQRDALLPPSPPGERQDNLTGHSERLGYAVAAAPRWEHTNAKPTRPFRSETNVTAVRWIFPASSTDHN